MRSKTPFLALDFVNLYLNINLKYREGFCRVDGTLGIELMTIKRYEFDEDNLSMEVVND